ncbi:calcium-binding protein [Tolypothrix campylonemoides VB511288]|nr:calcium-binding protein [Tolypothrix campylonemoides VB511288]
MVTVLSSNNISTADAAIVIQGVSTVQTFALVERNLIEGTDNPDIIFGTPGNDEISAKAGNDILFGTTGNDLLNGGDGFDTVDYSNLGQAITLLPRGAIGEGNTIGGQLQSIERIVGAAGQPNAIDASGARGGASLDVNLGENRLTVNNIPDIGSISFTVENFVNVTGTPFNDIIIGNSANNILQGSNIFRDSVDGPIINSTSERDVLTGGPGSDRFILGNASGSFYKFGGDNDFAQITDFSFGDQIQLGTGDLYNVQQSNTGFDIFVVTNGTSDLIAKVTLTTQT